MKRGWLYTFFQRLVEAGKRHSEADMAMIQGVHDHAVGLGATCGATEAEGDEEGMSEAARSYGQTANVLATAASTTFGGNRRYVYLDNVFDDTIVFRVCSYADDLPRTEALYQVSYVIDDADRVTFGQPVEVVARIVYEPIAPPDPAALSEAAIQGEIIPLVERAVRQDDGRALIKLIAPGWGSSGYYSEAVLRRDGPAVFKAGTHQYWNHPTLSEQVERPERDLRDLAATLVEDARYLSGGAAPQGDGLYAWSEVQPHYREAVESLAPHIGTSIIAYGQGREGSAEGRTGRIIERITRGESVDFVTQAGAGGAVVQLFEAARRRQAAPAPASNPTEDTMPLTPEEAARLEQLQESNRQMTTELARLREAGVIRDGRDLIREALSRAEYNHFPRTTRDRMARTLAVDLPVDASGSLDRTALETRVKEGMAAEAQYLASLGVGSIRGHGGQSPTPETTLEEAQATLEGAFGELGLSESIAKRAAVGRK